MRPYSAFRAAPVVRLPRVARLIGVWSLSVRPHRPARRRIRRRFEPITPARRADTAHGVRVKGGADPSDRSGSSCGSCVAGAKMTVVELSDAELVRGLRAGDAGCAALLLGRHRASMHVVAVSILGVGPDVDDVVQDALLVALSRFETLRDPDAVGVWLRGITRNLCRRRRRSTPMQVHVQWSDAVDVGFEPQALESLAIRDWVWTALNELSPPLRHVMVLRYFTRVRRYDAIALVLGIPVGTVRSRLSGLAGS